MEMGLTIVRRRRGWVAGGARSRKQDATTKPRSSLEPEAGRKTPDGEMASVDGAGWIYAARKMCVTIVAPEPPMFCAMPMLAPSTWVPEAVPRSCSTSSQT